MQQKWIYLQEVINIVIELLKAKSSIVIWT